MQGRKYIPRICNVISHLPLRGVLSWGWSPRLDLWHVGPSAFCVTQASGIFRTLTIWNEIKPSQWTTKMGCDWLVWHISHYFYRRAVLHLKAEFNYTQNQGHDIHIHIRITARIWAFSVFAVCQANNAIIPPHLAPFPHTTWCASFGQVQFTWSHCFAPTWWRCQKRKFIMDLGLSLCWAWQCNFDSEPLRN